MSGWYRIWKRSKLFLTVKKLRSLGCCRIMLLLYLFGLFLILTKLYKPPKANKEIDLIHFKHHRNLDHYIKNAKILIEPSRIPCTKPKEIQLIALVNSAPHHIDYRHAIRATWGQHFLTYFYMGRVDNDTDFRYMNKRNQEAKHNNDIIVFDFKEHYQNLSIKTGLMLNWVLKKCPEAGFVFKVDDDILVNPWMIKKALEEQRKDVKLFGLLHKNAKRESDKTNRWYIPEWLCDDKVFPFVLSGSGYIINVIYLESIVQAACSVPLINMEDVFYTYYVANKTLGYHLTHVEGFSPYRPQPTWFPFPSCAFWTQATMHRFDPREMITAWRHIEDLSHRYLKGENVCAFYRYYLKPWVYMGLSRDLCGVA